MGGERQLPSEYRRSSTGGGGLLNVGEFEQPVVDFSTWDIYLNIVILGRLTKWGREKLCFC